MGRVRKLKLSVDFNELFGIPVENQALREAIGGRIIDKIVARTEGGTDLNGKPFKGYSSSYVNSLAFKVYGKSKNVDLTLSGDMLSSMQVTESKKNKITIGFPSDLENAKAFNHNTGDTLPKREFFGITKEEKNEIVNEFEQDVLDFADFQATKDEQKAVDLISRLIDENDGGD